MVRKLLSILGLFLFSLSSFAESEHLTWKQLGYYHNANSITNIRPGAKLKVIESFSGMLTCYDLLSKDFIERELISISNSPQDASYQDRVIFNSASTKITRDGALEWVRISLEDSNDPLCFINVIPAVGFSMEIFSPKSARFPKSYFEEIQN